MTKKYPTTDICSIKKKVKYMLQTFLKLLPMEKHSLLIYKLIEKGKPGDLTKLSECYLYNQIAKITWNNPHNEYKPIK